MAADPKPTAEHICILIHGLWGNPAHLNHLRDTLLTRHADERLHVLVVKSNADYNTYDGIEVGGERIVHEIEQELAKLEGQGIKIKKISVVGYSLGGLLARYTVGLLYAAGIFDQLKPINFTTFASPHIGVRTPTRGYRSAMWNFLGGRTLSTSGQQMFTIDKFRDTGRPLLSIMADPRSVFYKGLNSFKHKSLYANTMNDRSVPFHSAAFSSVDPFVDVRKINVNYLPKEGKGVILDPTNPVSLKESGPKGSIIQRVTSTPQGTLNSIPFYIILFATLPLAFPLFIMNAAYQTFLSTKRMRLHESGQAIDLDRYRIPFLEETQHVEDRVIDQLAGHRPEQYLPTPPPDSPASSTAATNGAAPTPAASSAANEKPSINSTSSPDGANPPPKRRGPFPLLALTPDQFEMIENLDRLGFIKYPAHIQKVRHTHAAVVVRMNKASFSEGKVITSHWAKHFEV